MNNELQHHGILGMKWGVRRYQNEDGSLTPAGQKRYNTMRDASAYAKARGDVWKRSYDDEKKSIQKYKEKYSGENGLKKYKKDWDDPNMSDKEAERLLKVDIKDMELNAQSMQSLAKEWYDQADTFQRYNVSDSPSKLLNKGKKYAKEWERWNKG